MNAALDHHRVDINGNRLAVDILGVANAPTIVALHGAPGLGSRHEPRTSFGRLADTYRVVVFDARGCGESEGHGPYTHEQWAQDVDALRQWLGEDRIIIAGGSYGGFIAMEYALRYQDRVAALVLRDTAADSRHHALARQNALQSTRVRVDMAKFDRIDQGRVRDDDDLRDCWQEILPLYDFTYDPEAVARKVAATPYRYQTHNFAFSQNLPSYDLRDQLHTLTIPTLVTVGRADWITPVRCSEAIADLIPHAELKVFERSGHSPQLEEATEWTATVRTFLQRHLIPRTP